MNTTHTLKTTTLAIALAFAATCITANAADQSVIGESQQPLAVAFVKLDTTADGSLTMNEAAQDKLFTSHHFSKADTDKNGMLNEQEYANYKTADQKNKVARVVDDGVITTKVKAKLLAAKDLKSLKISVKTYRGEVILSGFVENAAMKQKAEQIVSNIQGVRLVKNSLVVKS